MRASRHSVDAAPSLFFRSSACASRHRRVFSIPSFRTFRPSLVCASVHMGTTWVRKSWRCVAIPATAPRRTRWQRGLGQGSGHCSIKRRGPTTHTRGRYDASVVRQAVLLERCTTTGVVTAFAVAIFLFAVTSHSSLLDCRSSRIRLKETPARPAAPVLGLPCAT